MSDAEGGCQKEILESRERVLRTIDHEPVDRMPIDLGMHYSTGISAFAYWELREYLNLRIEDVYIPDMVQFLAKVEEDILEIFHCDCILLHPGWSRTHRWNPRGKYEFIIPKSAQPRSNENCDWVMETDEGKMRMPKNGFFFDGDWLDLEERSEDETIKATAEEARRIYTETDYFTAYIGFSSYYGQSMDFLCRMIEDPASIKEQNKVLLEKEIEKAMKIIESMGESIQAICMAGDLGTQQGPMVRPSLYEELCAPFLEKFCRFIHENGDLKVFLHTCGSIKPFMSTFIDCGVDVLNPVQISADNMDPRELKEEFGEKITFWGGGCNTQKVLGRGTPKEVKENVKKLVNIFKPGGGFVFNQVHNIMGNVPPENIVAMMDAAYETSFF